MIYYHMNDTVNTRRDTARLDNIFFNILNKLENMECTKIIWYNWNIYLFAVLAFICILCKWETKILPFIVVLKK